MNCSRRFSPTSTGRSSPRTCWRTPAMAGNGALARLPRPFEPVDWTGPRTRSHGPRGNASSDALRRVTSPHGNAEVVARDAGTRGADRTSPRVQTLAPPSPALPPPGGREEFVFSQVSRFHGRGELCLAFAVAG